MESSTFGEIPRPVNPEAFRVLSSVILRTLRTPRKWFPYPDQTAHKDEQGMSNEGTSGNTSRTGTTSFESQPEGGSFSPIRLRPGGVANAVGGAFREFSGSGSANPHGST
jgi:hypothetical protein